mgnify:CR=1 FL=1
MFWASGSKLFIMNSIEQNDCMQLFGTIDGKTMEDFFIEQSAMLGKDVDFLKSEYKKYHSDETNWSF